MYGKRRAFQRRVPLLLIVAVAAFLLKTAMAYLTYGTNDVTFWQQSLVKAETEGWAAVYREGVRIYSSAGQPYVVQPFVQPPSMSYALRFWSFLAALTHLTLQFWIRFTCALADAGSLFVVWRMARELPALRIQASTLVLLAACPVSILISGFHGQFDPIMMFFLVISIYWIETKRPLAWAGIFMGLALSVKVMPIILIPAILLYLPGLKSKLRFACFAGATLFLTGLPYNATDSMLVLHRIAGYNSQPSIWLSFSARLGLSSAVDKAIFVLSIILFSIAMNRFRPGFPLFAQCGLLTSLALLIAPGFGVQYLAWAVPWIVYLGLRAALSYYLAAGTFLFVVYTQWSGGLPWYRAEALTASPLGSFLNLFCWYLTAMILVLYVRAWLNQPGGTLSPE